MKKTIAIIPALGSSKKIQKTSIRDFLGKPIIAYPIEEAKKSMLFDLVVVSTDDEEIAKKVRNYGVEILFMGSRRNADDYASAGDVLIETLKEYKKQGINFDIMACIFPTAPFVNADRLRQAVDLMKRYRPALVMPIVKFSYPPQRSYRIDSNGYASFIEPKYIQTRSQDLEPMYYDSSQFYIHDPEKIIELNRGILDNIMAIVLDDSEVQDINTEEDWKLAEMKYNLYHMNDKI